MTDRLNQVVSENISAEITRLAQQQATSIAIYDARGDLTYGQLENAIAGAIAELKQLGLQQGDLVLAVGENSLGYSVFLLSAARMGLVAVLENARRAAPEIEGIIAHAEPSAQFYFHDNSPDCISHTSYFKAGIQHSKFFGEYGFIKAQNQAEHGIKANVFAIIFTTGTTGSPKGVMLTHENLNFIAKMMHQLRDITPQDRVLAALPISHVMGLASVFLGALHSGASICFLPKFSPQKCLDLISQLQITVLQGAPVMFAKLLDHIRKHDLSGFTSLRFLGSGGAPIDKVLKEGVATILGCTLQNGYGLTEIPSVAWTRFGDHQSDDSVGLAIPGVEIEFRQADGDLAEVGEVGELWVRGPNLMFGYFKNPELNCRVIDRDGWFNTQDLGYLNADGYMYIVGRTKDLIIRSGFKVYPLEVESVLLSHPSVLHAAVVGRPTADNEEVWAFIEPDKQHTLSVEEVTAYLSTQLSPYKRPSKIILMDSLPLAANGKVLKSQLISTIA